MDLDELNVIPPVPSPMAGVSVFALGGGDLPELQLNARVSTGFVTPHGQSYMSILQPGAPSTQPAPSMPAYRIQPVADTQPTAHAQPSSLTQPAHQDVPHTQFQAQPQPPPEGFPGFLGGDVTGMVIGQLQDLTLAVKDQAEAQ